MKRFLTILALALAPLAALAPAARAAPTPIAGAERAQAISLANQALNLAGPVQGRFVQIGPNNVPINGMFYLQRPGKVRFAYDAPSAMAIVSDGTVVSLEDRALKTVNRMPLKTTPLNLLLKRDVNLERDTNVTNVARDGTTIFIGVRERRSDSNGELTLVFDGPSRELRQWRVRDRAGNITITALQTVQNVARLDPKLFVTMQPPPSPRSRP
jgi:outer membrane lipoprotein-sorting protein